VLVGLDVHAHEEVAGGCAAGARLALAGDPEGLPRLDAGGHGDVHLAVLLLVASAVAVVARGLGRGAGAAADGAGGGHHEEALAMRDLASAAALGAGGELSALGARPVARL